MADTFNIKAQVNASGWNSAPQQGTSSTVFNEIDTATTPNPFYLEVSDNNNVNITNLQVQFNNWDDIKDYIACQSLSVKFAKKEGVHTLYEYNTRIEQAQSTIGGVIYPKNVQNKPDVHEVEESLDCYVHIVPRIKFIADNSAAGRIESITCFWNINSDWPDQKIVSPINSGDWISLPDSGNTKVYCTIPLINFKYSGDISDVTSINLYVQINGKSGGGEPAGGYLNCDLGSWEPITQGVYSGEYAYFGNKSFPICDNAFVGFDVEFIDTSTSNSPAQGDDNTSPTGTESSANPEQGGEVNQGVLDPPEGSNLEGGSIEANP